MENAFPRLPKRSVFFGGGHPSATSNDGTRTISIVRLSLPVDDRRDCHAICTGKSRGAGLQTPTSTGLCQCTPQTQPPPPTPFTHLAFEGGSDDILVHVAQGAVLRVVVPWPERVAFERVDQCVASGAVQQLPEGVHPLVPPADDRTIVATLRRIVPESTAAVEIADRTNRTVLTYGHAFRDRQIKRGFAHTALDPRAPVRHTEAVVRTAPALGQRRGAAVWPVRVDRASAASVRSSGVFVVSGFTTGTRQALIGSALLAETTLYALLEPRLIPNATIAFGAAGKCVPAPVDDPPRARHHRRHHGGAVAHQPRRTHLAAVGVGADDVLLFRHAGLALLQVVAEDPGR
eukprot:608248-Rhodomonas_salina.3